MDRKAQSLIKKHLAPGLYESHPIDRIRSSQDVECARSVLSYLLWLAVAHPHRAIFAMVETAIAQLSSALRLHAELHVPLAMPVPEGLWVAERPVKFQPDAEI